MAFRASLRDHTATMDAARLHGGEDSGPSPKELVLAGLLGCTGMDVVALLRKYKAPVTALELSADAEQTDSQPAVFSTIKVIYEASGEGVKTEDLLKAVELSQTRYCGVSAMISKTARIFYEVRLNGSMIGEGEARFQ
jgi:putative redox protein